MMSLARARAWLKRHLCFVGPGLVAAVAYIDPGNWATDLQAGAEYGYKLLFVVFLASMAAVVLQILSVRLGAVTSQSLARQTRLLFLGWEAAYPKYRGLFRAGLYLLWALAEVAIVATDLAELLGSAIALNLLFPRLPLFAGVLITAVDVLVVLVFFRSDGGRQGMMFFEIVIVALVLAVFVSFAILLHLIKPEWREVFYGLVPSKTLVNPGALYIGIGIIGATIMPHALFLGSALSSIDRLGMLPVPPSRVAKPQDNPMPSIFRPWRRLRSNEQARAAETGSAEPTPSGRISPNVDTPPVPELGSPRQLDAGPSRTETKDDPSKDDDEDYVLALKRYEQEIRRFDRIRWVEIHVLHASVDTVYSLVGFALTINAAILTLAGAAYHYGAYPGVSSDDADLAGAHAMLKAYIGNGSAIIFAIALLCAGQSASITATLAGQVVSEGFLEWKTSPLIRRLITRLLGVIPAAIVAAAVGNKGLDSMLVASQVILCVVLPTVTVPLVYLCSKREVMSVDGPAETSPLCTRDGVELDDLPTHRIQGTPGNVEEHRATSATSAQEVADDTTAVPDTVSYAATVVSIPVSVPRARKSFVSPKWITVLGWLINFVVILANGYVIIMLCLGKT